jgi:hypothetical protein
MNYPTQSVRQCDVIVQGHGSIVLLWPQNRAVKDWLYEQCDVQQTWGEGIAVEPRYVSAIIEGLEQAGFSTQ